MRGVDFISYTSKPQNLTSEQFGELEQIREKYPWFAASHILLCKAHKNENRFSHQSLLKKASLYTNDREVLYEVMTREPHAKLATVTDGRVPMTETVTDDRQPVTEIVEDVVTEAEDVVEEVEPVISDPLPVTPDERSEDEETVTDDRQPVTETIEDVVTESVEVIEEAPPVISDPSPVTSDEQSEDKETVTDDRQPVTETIEDVVTETEDIVEKTEPVIGDPLPETSDEQTEDVIYDPVKELQKLIPEGEEEFEDHDLVPIPMYDPEKELMKLIQEEAVVESEVSQETEVPTEQNERQDESEVPTEQSERRDDEEGLDTFLHWLDDFSAEETSKPESPKAKQPKKEKKKAKKKKKEKEDQDPQELLDAFLKNRPAMRRMKKDFYNPQNMAKQSLRDDLGLVTETLAKLHVKQGNYQRAIEIYEELRLQNPKNITYFAARIEELRNQIEKENG